jgi:chaperone required for assembly of F1-ATPase
VAAQTQHWDPVLAWACDTHGARFALSEGLIFVAQPEKAMTAVRAAIPSEAWRLGAVHLITTLTGSALIALAVAARELDVDEAWPQRTSTKTGT